MVTVAFRSISRRGCKMDDLWMVPQSHGIPEYSRQSENYTLYPPYGTVLSKEEAGYVDSGRPFGCRNCMWFEADKGTCDPIGDQESISAFGCCDWWGDPQAPKAVGKAAAEYVYEPNSPDYSCGNCAFYDPYKTVEGRGTCKIVEGPINAAGSCNKQLVKVPDAPSSLEGW